MSESDGEQLSRSLALEQAYVHEVYEQCAEKTVQSSCWPRIYEFLEELEPGALVCDIGCGNGKYLNVNHNVFKVGVDRCTRLTNIAQEKGNEVLTCDNLALPFRDESFDAVLSIAVIHHFSTTERRVRALKELARVLRIGGRLIISVWAMEQRHRKFESQDVLVPWPKTSCLNPSGRPIKPRGSSCDERQRNKNIQGYLLSKSQRKSSNSNNSANNNKNKNYWVDPIFSPSPSSSSLSSPNETCYSFFRRALQKLAGGRRGSRPWFLENWQNSGKHRRHYEDDDDNDVGDLPIELRRLEDSTTINISNNKHPDNLSVKSKSLSDILESQRLDIVRSRSSIPGFCSTMMSEERTQDEENTGTNTTSIKPRLVKQKTHFGDDTCLDFSENTAIQDLIKEIPDLQASSAAKRGNVHKQSSMNEEFMSIERLKENESVRRNIMKQASLNEELMYKGRTFEAFRESIYSSNATKSFQLLKKGLTNRIRQSTTNIEKVSGMSIKNGFVRIFQSWKSTESQVPATGTSCDYVTSQMQGTDKSPSTTMMKRDLEYIERRPSREDGSDSSKDSSLQSDTSVDSEDSFASVIYVPKQNVAPLIDMITAPSGYQLNTTSAPPSPRVKYPPDLLGPRLKLITISPLLKQFPATSKSLPPPSPPGLSPRTINSATMKPFFSGPSSNQHQATSAALFEKFLNAKKSADEELSQSQPSVIGSTKPGDGIDSKLPEKRPSLKSIRSYKSLSGSVDTDIPTIEEVASPTSTSSREGVVDKVSEKSSTESASEEDEESRRSRLIQIKELLKQKPGFATRSKPSFPLVRRASTATGRAETTTKVLPRLLSLELFNPETDDLDSDSSGVSSPDSSGSVISVISDERYLSKKEAANKSEENSSDSKSGSADASSKDLPPDTGISQALPEDTKASAASSTNESKDDFDRSITPVESTWNEECRQHLIDVTEKLTENLIHGIDEYCKKSQLELVEDLEYPTRRYLADASDPYPGHRSLETCKYSRLVESAPWTKTRTDNDFFEFDNNGSDGEHLIHRSASEESIGSFVVISNAGEFVNDSKDGNKEQRLQDDKGQLRFGNSVESSDIGDSIENTISESSQADSFNTRRFCSVSTASLSSNITDYGKGIHEKASRYAQNRSASEEIPTSRVIHRNADFDRSMTVTSTDTYSGSSSQDSLSSDQGGSNMTYHQYYHVFREGELDQLINKYVENLHIISSYYDHASWCIVAEKVQVWTI